MEFKTEMGTYIRVQKRSNMTWEEHNNMCRELINVALNHEDIISCLLYTSPSPRD